jgi:hypothetical protein
MAKLSSYIPSARGVFPFNLNLGNSVVIGPDDNLQDKYDWLKSSDRDTKMGALTRINRRTLILSPGTYTLTSTLILNTPYIDITSLTDSSSDTIVEGYFSNAPVIDVTAFNMKLSNFTVYNSDPVGSSLLHNDALHMNVVSEGSDALVQYVSSKNRISSATNDFYALGVEQGDYIYCDTATGAGLYQIYTIDTDYVWVLPGFSGNESDVDFYIVSVHTIFENMDFICADNITAYSFPVLFPSNSSGLWRNCTSRNLAWRQSANVTMRPVMYDCIGEFSCFGSDQEGAVMGGEYYRCISGGRSFGGCGTFGCEVSGKLYDCIAGDDSYAKGREFSGEAYRCIGGADCFAGFQSSPYFGTFSGYAEDCIASGDSFGGGHANCINTGTMVRCKITDITNPIYIDGATIRDCYMETTATDTDCIYLNSNNPSSNPTTIYNSTIITNGTGKSINNSSDVDSYVISSHNRMNSAMGSHVINLIETPYDVVDVNII